MATRKAGVPSSRSHLTLSVTPRRRELLDEICAQYPGRDVVDSIFRALEEARVAAAGVQLRKEVRAYLRDCTKLADRLSPAVRDHVEEAAMAALAFIGFGVFSEIPEILVGRELTPRERAALDRDAAAQGEREARLEEFTPDQRAEIDTAMRHIMERVETVWSRAWPEQAG